MDPHQPDIIEGSVVRNADSSGSDLDAMTPAAPTHAQVHAHVPQTRDAAFRQVTAAAPANDYGLPVFIYRPDLIPAEINSMDDDERMHILTGAAIDIIYDEGFPTFSDGTAFWSQMPFEPSECYEHFKSYLEQGDTQGIRRLETLFHDSAETTVLDGAARQAIREAFVFYNWAARCKAYDLFKVAAHHKLRERRILSIQDQQFLKAESLLGKLDQYFERKDEETGELEWIRDLNPKVAIEFLEKLTRIQRASLGLGSHGVADDAGLSKNADVSVTLRQLAAGAQDPSAAGNQNDAGDLSLLLSDPDMAGMAQELIIKVGEAARK